MPDEYELLTDEMKAEIVAALKVKYPDPKIQQLALEKAHYEATLEAELLGTTPPDPFKTELEVAQETLAAVQADPNKDVTYPDPSDRPGPRDPDFDAKQAAYDAQIAAYNAKMGDPAAAQKVVDDLTARSALNEQLDQIASTLPAIADVAEPKVGP